MTVVGKEGTLQQMVFFRTLGSSLKRLSRNASLLIGLLLLTAIAVLALGAPWLAPSGPETMDMANRLAAPGGGHILGTDNFGRDLWARILFGSRISLGVSLASVTVSTLVGTLLGLISGYYGGWIDTVIMRVVDIVLGFPVIILALALVAVLGPGARNVVLALVAVFWTQYARVVRASTLSEREREYVQAAKAAGMSDARILLRHILPNVLDPAVVMATLGIGTAILSESTLSFLGLGVQPPAPSWGWTLAYGMRFLRDDPYLSIFPGLAIMLTVLAFNLLGDGLRDLFSHRG